MNELQFGKFEQGDGPAPIQWLVLAQEGNRKLLLSKYALFPAGIHNTMAKLTWDACDLRKHLNGEFLTQAFSAQEQAKIQTTQVKADKNPEFETVPGADTEDKVFLLSIPEVEQYLPETEDRICRPTPWAAQQGVYTKVEGEGCYWWVRTPGYETDCIARVQLDGSVFTYGTYVCINNHGVRPAMWIED